MKLLEKYKLDPRFGYGSVSESYLRERCELLERLEDPDDWVGMWQVLGTSCGGYNSFWDDIVMDVVKDQMVVDSKGIFLYDKKDEQKMANVEIINYMLCSQDICEYGSSPRFPWLTEYGRVVLELYFKQERPDWLDERNI